MSAAQRTVEDHAAVTMPSTRFQPCAQQGELGVNAPTLRFVTLFAWIAATADEVRARRSFAQLAA
jgi:hypothetical protein